MVIPVQDQTALSPVPSRVRELHVYFWWMLFVLLIGVSVGRVLSLDVLGGLNSALMAYFVHTMVKDGCIKMTQYCLFLFGFLCFVTSILEAIALEGSINGRFRQTANPIASSSSSTSYSITIEKHPFFDITQGPIYLLQSAMMIASPVVSFFGALISYLSYNAYPTTVFEEEEQLPFSVSSGQVLRHEAGYGQLSQPAPFEGVGRALGYGQASPPTPFQGSANVLGSRPNAGSRVFEGAGQRLGS